jgi:hypothetical protein
MALDTKCREFCFIAVIGVRQYRIFIKESESEATSSMLSTVNEQTVSEV